MRTVTCLSARGGSGRFGHLFEASDLEVVAPDKALEAQRMEILRKDLPVLFDAEALGGLRRGTP